MSAIRTRIAPSPTGNLHVGTARSALFNELFAHQQGGTFIVRIEDTDKQRSTKAYEENVLAGLQWLGLQWDEGPDVGGAKGPYRQSERVAHYTAAIQQLLAAGLAYQVPDGEAVKLTVEPQEVIFTDLLRGEVRFHTDAWGGDFVIARSITDPVFHLAVVVDDAAMEISHVIRGDDHLSNTARHILLQRALGLPTPQYAHVPLLLDQQRRKLSKRAGETSLLAYRDAGYLPEAMLNFLALLGWNPKNDQEFFSHQELLQQFSLDGVQKGGAIFSEQKLQSINKHYLRQLSPTDLLQQARPYLEAAGYDIIDTTYWAKAVQTEQERIATVRELPEKLQYFRSDWDSAYDPSLLVWRKSTPEDTQRILQHVRTFLATLPPERFTITELEHDLLAWIDQQALGRGDTLWPLRVALTGLDKSPSPFEVASVIGQPATLQRIDRALEKLGRN